MKKLLTGLLCCALLLVGCNEAQETADTPKENNIVIEEAPQDIDGNTAKLFLNGELTVDSFGSKEKITVGEICSFGTPARYSLTDLDNDGARELIVECAPSGDRVIIRICNGKSTAYYLPIRSYNVIKKDGTASWSASAFESGTHKIKFVGADVEFEDIIIFNTTDGIFKVNGEEVTEEECNQAVKAQHEKESIEWIDIDL